MDKHNKRPRSEDSSSSSSNVAHTKKLHSSPTSKPSTQFQQQQMGKRSNFISYLETPNLAPKIKLLCEIIAITRSIDVEKVLDDTGVRVSQQDVEQVLKLSYGYPGPAVKFFRWCGAQLCDKHSPYAWNLVVDLLGKNGLFDAMWEAIKSMKKAKLLSLATFASVFSSYASADRVKEAILTFDVMAQYGCLRDIVALNSLLSAICREGKTEKATEFLGVVKNMIRPDGDTYAILLEGWETEGDASSARRTFAEMVSEIGWDPRNVAAYDSFLTTLLKGPDGMPKVMSFFEGMKEKGCSPGIKFFKVALEDCVKRGDLKGARFVWDEMVMRNGFRPDTGMYNSMIALHCYLNDIDAAKGLLDEMICHGAFPDSQTYNVFFQFLMKSKRLKDASPVFTEMIKNECVPNHTNCKAAVRGYMDNGEPYMAIKVWKCMIENYDYDLEDTGNLLVLGLRDFNRVPEAVKYAEDMIDRGIKLHSSTLSRLKQSLSKAGKALAFDELLRKWKTHSMQD